MAAASSKGVGPKYLVQHSAGSGKSNSIAWLAHRLIGLEGEGKALFDSVVVVTDRKVLDKQIRDTIRQFAQVGSVVGHAENSGNLRTLLQEGKRIVITTVLAEETDPNRLHDLKAALDGYQVYSPAQVDELVGQYLSGADRDQLDPILDTCVSLYREQLDEDGQVDFKGKAKAFLRTYGFLAAILPYTYAEWEKLSIFLTFIVPKLPAPTEGDLSKGILEAIDMDSYRVEKQAVQDIQLPDEDAEIGPVPTEGGGQKPEPEMDRLSNIIKDFNDRFGNIQWKDQDKIEKVIAEELPTEVAGDRAYQNAMANSDEQNARIEHDKALERAMTELLADHTELFKQFSDNESFRRWLSEMVFAATYNRTAALIGAAAQE